MGLDLHLYDKDDDEVMWVNWLRNPFGLCNWVEDNLTELGYNPETSLYYVCNHWAYKEDGADRPLFQKVVNEYWRRVEDLEQGYFFFSLSSYRQFVEGKTGLMIMEEGIAGPRIKGEKYAKDGSLMIPMWQFSHPEFRLSGPDLQDYKDWMKRLVKFAELLQNEEYTFSCSR